MYAIVDIETTGSYAAANGITEVAIHVFDGEKVTEKFETLINPGQFIPRYIQAFTGISNEMVENAPSFEEAAESIYKLLRENIFIAHNVNFDYSFIKSHLLKAGFDLNAKKLCTVRLSRKIFPGLPSYSLGNLCRSLNIEASHRHRAGGDVSATVEVFRKLIENDRESFILRSLQRNSKEQSLPPHAPKSDFDNLPWTPGVYYFHNQKGKIIYVGKARNIRSRVSSHFSNNSDGKQKQNFLKHVHSISFHSCATELMAEILESSEIKRLWPQFNQSQKHWENVYGIFMYEDQNGYLRLAIEKNKRNLSPVFNFHYLTEGHAVLRKLIAEYNLCPKLCFMQTGNAPCAGMEENTCRGACIKKEKPRSYNKRVNKAIESLQTQPSYAIIDKGLGEDEQSCILVINGKFYGMGYIPGEASVHSTAELKDYLTTYKENNYIRSLLAGYAAKNPSKVVSLNPSIEMVL